MNSSIWSTLGPRALDVGSLNHFEAIEMLIAIQKLTNFNSNLKIRQLIQHYPELQVIPTLVHPS